MKDDLTLEQKHEWESSMASATRMIEMTPLEIASGAVWGTDPEAEPLRPAPVDVTARTALEAVVRTALQRPPCVLSFSGGRDSSAVLAMAMAISRREGLAPPVPLTIRFTDYEPAGEDDWQERVVRHLGVEDWTRIDIDDELDLLGPYGRRVLRRHGVMWPANAYSHLPIIEDFAGGSLLTGVGGDEILSTDPLSVRVNQLLLRQIRPRPRDVLRFAAFFTPRGVRRIALARSGPTMPPWPWLTPDAEREVRAGILDDSVAEPLRWDDSIDRGLWRSRIRRMSADSLDRVGEMCGVAVHSPLTDPVFLAAFAAEGGRRGPLSRTDAMRSLFGDLLPDEVLGRVSKAEMGGGFLSRSSREFAHTWDGSGVDPDLVRVDVLRRMWTDPDRQSDFRTFPLLQSAWLATAGAEHGPRG